MLEPPINRGVNWYSSRFYKELVCTWIKTPDPKEKGNSYFNIDVADSGRENVTELATLRLTRNCSNYPSFKHLTLSFSTTFNWKDEPCALTISANWRNTTKHTSGLVSITGTKRARQGSLVAICKPLLGLIGSEIRESGNQLYLWLNENNALLAILCHPATPAPYLDSQTDQVVEKRRARCEIGDCGFLK